MEILILIIVILLSAFLFLIMPRITPRPMHEFKGRYYAHRGLHDNSSDAPENSMKAFRLAAEKGYGIELDVRLTKDEKVVVFHDNNLKRICGVETDVNTLTYEELQELSLLNTEEKIPLFIEVLKLVNGKVPLIVEIKMVDNTTRVCELANEILKEYKGIYCVESFNAHAVKWYRVHRPDICRGQLSANFNKEGQKEDFQQKLMHHLLVNVIARPDFVAYSHKSADNLSRNLCRMFGAVSVAWTIKSQEQLDKNRKKFDIFIFEGFIPE